MKKTKVKTAQKEEVEIEEEIFDADIDHLSDEFDEDSPPYTQEEDPFS